MNEQEAFAGVGRAVIAAIALGSAIAIAANASKAAEMLGLPASFGIAW